MSKKSTPRERGFDLPPEGAGGVCSEFLWSDGVMEEPK